jgi:rhamnogalacturonyl hydrolase YesR
MQALQHIDVRDFDGAIRTEAGRRIYESLKRAEKWVEDHHYQAYEPFDGLSSPLRSLTLGNLFFDRLLLQAVRQSPINLRPLLGIKPLPSTKGRGYMAAGYLTLYRLTGDVEYKDKAVRCLEWLMEHKSPRFEDHAWSNHFDFASRAGRYSRHDPIIVWSALIGQAFLDGYEALGDRRFLSVADSVCRWILALPRERTTSGNCISYYMIAQSCVHNANMLGAAMLARTWKHTRNPEYLEAAAEAMKYSCTRQRPDGSWLYAEDPKYHWIDGFHTGYNLDSLKCYVDSTGDTTYRNVLSRGLDYYKRHFFEESGCPRYYHNRTQPIDSQCAAQAIETMARFAESDPECLDLGRRVADWTIANMQDKDGHFYYRVYPVMKAKAPMLHWAQATIYRGLAELLHSLARA